MKHDNAPGHFLAPLSVCVYVCNKKKKKKRNNLLILQMWNSLLDVSIQGEGGSN